MLNFQSGVTFHLQNQRREFVRLLVMAFAGGARPLQFLWPAIGRQFCANNISPMEHKVTLRKSEFGKSIADRMRDKISQRYRTLLGKFGFARRGADDAPFWLIGGDW